MPKKIRDEYEDRCRRLWFDAHGADPEASIEGIYNQVLLEEFDGSLHRFRVDPGESRKAWPEDQRPSLSWFTKRIKNKWPKEVVAEPSEDNVAMPWGSFWGDDPARIRILSVLSDLASEVRGGTVKWLIDDRKRRKKPLDYYSLVELSDFQGFTESVCDWACKLSAFFDLESRNQSLLLIHFAYVFANEERNAKVFEEPMSIQSEASKMLMRWHKRYQQPDLTGKMFEQAQKDGEVHPLFPEKEDWRGTPFWEHDNWGNLEQVVSQDLNPTFSFLQINIDGLGATKIITDQSAGDE